MPGLISPTGVPLVDILSRAGGAVFKPKFDDKYRDEISGIDALTDPNQRIQKIAEVGRRAAADGYSLQDRAALSSRADAVIDDAMRANTGDSIAQVARYQQLLGRTRPASINQMLRLPGQIAGDQARAGYWEAGIPKQAALTRQAETGATRNLAQAGLAGTRASDITATQPGRIALTEEQTNLVNAQTQRALQQPDSKTFHLVIKNPVTGKDEQVLFDAQGNLVRSLGEASTTRGGGPGGLSATTKSMVEAAPKVLELASRVDELVNQQAQRLGPAGSRWAEYMAGTIGAPNPEFTRLRTTVGLLTTLLMRMHVGARGSEKIMEHFKGLIDSSKQSPQNLKAALAEITEYARDVAALGQAQSEAQNSPPSGIQLPPGYSLTPVQ